MHTSELRDTAVSGEETNTILERPESENEILELHNVSQSPHLNKLELHRILDSAFGADEPSKLAFNNDPGKIEKLSRVLKQHIVFAVSSSFRVPIPHELLLRCFRTRGGMVLLAEKYSDPSAHPEGTTGTIGDRKADIKTLKNLLASLPNEYGIGSSKKGNEVRKALKAIMELAVFQKNSPYTNPPIPPFPRYKFGPWCKRSLEWLDAEQQYLCDDKSIGNEKKGRFSDGWKHSFYRSLAVIYTELTGREAKISSTDRGFSDTYDISNYGPFGSMIVTAFDEVLSSLKEARYINADVKSHILEAWKKPHPETLRASGNIALTEERIFPLVVNSNDPERRKVKRISCKGQKIHCEDQLFSAAFLCEDEKRLKKHLLKIASKK